MQTLSVDPVSHRQAGGSEARDAKDATEGAAHQAGPSDVAGESAPSSAGSVFVADEHRPVEPARKESRWESQEPEGRPVRAKETEDEIAATDDKHRRRGFGCLMCFV
jgi:hypothetical protein